MDKRAYAKLEILKQNIKKLEKLAVAYSSGVDSTFLLQTAREVLGENAIAVTVCSEAFPKRETMEAEEFCKSRNIPQITINFKPLQLDGFAQNPKDRCYHCKKELLKRISDAAKEKGFYYVAEGSNMDDLGDYRPGLLAVEELGILSPLREAGLYKEEIRLLSKDMGLPTWDKPSYACLASRFVYGEEITLEKLNRVEQAEDFLMEQEFWQMRVRVHGNLARIEVLPEELGQFLEEDFRRKVCERFRELGFSHVSLDLQGYRTGSMNV